MENEKETYFVVLFVNYKNYPASNHIYNNICFKFQLQNRSLGHGELYFRIMIVIFNSDT
jgi:hypothetical protein